MQRNNGTSYYQISCSKQCRQKYRKKLISKMSLKSVNLGFNIS